MPQYQVASGSASGWVFAGTVTSASSPDPASSPAQIRHAVRNAAFTELATRYWSPLSPVSSGSAATASSPAARAAALFTPLAIPARRTSTAASTVAVRGATSMVSPIPKNIADGNTSDQ